jgi:hypothetical protein
MQDWSEGDFQARVNARIEQLGKPETTLLRNAGLTGDEIRKIPKRARRNRGDAEVHRASRSGGTVDRSAPRSCVFCLFCELPDRVAALHR